MWLTIEGLSRARAARRICGLLKVVSSLPSSTCGVVNSYAVKLFAYVMGCVTAACRACTVSKVGSWLCQALVGGFFSLKGLGYAWSSAMVGRGEVGLMFVGHILSTCRVDVWNYHIVHM